MRSMSDAILIAVLGHRLAQRQHADGHLPDIGLQVVDALVVLHHLGGELAVAPHQRFDRAGQLRFRKPAHLRDHVVEVLQILVEALDDMLGLLGDHDFLDLPAQPKRPVM
jgi:hypothetical protein